MTGSLQRPHDVFFFYTVNSIVDRSKESDRFIYRRVFSCCSNCSIIDWRLNRHPQRQSTISLLYDAQTTSQSRKHFYLVCDRIVFFISATKSDAECVKISILSIDILVCLFSNN